MALEKLTNHACTSPEFKNAVGEVEDQMRKRVHDALLRSRLSWFRNSVSELKNV